MIPGLQFGIFLGLFFACFETGAQELIFRSASQLGAGGIGSSDLNGEVFTLNPAHLAQSQGWSSSLNYTLPYHERALGQSFMHLAYGHRLGTLGFKAGVSGIRLSSFRRVSLAYARSFGKTVYVGMEYSVVQHQLTDSYLSGFLLAGLVFQPGREWRFSFLIQNPEQNKLKYPMAAFSMPSVCWLSARTQLHPMVALLIEWEKEWYQSDVWKVAGVVTPHKRLLFSIGATGKPLNLSAGAGGSWNNFKIHVGISHHQWLGVSSAASLLLHWPHKAAKQ